SPMRMALSPRFEIRPKRLYCFLGAEFWPQLVIVVLFHVEHEPIGLTNDLLEGCLSRYRGALFSALLHLGVEMLHEHGEAYNPHKPLVRGWDRCEKELEFAQFDCWDLTDHDRLIACSFLGLHSDASSKGLEAFGHFGIPSTHRHDISPFSASCTLRESVR